MTKRKVSISLNKEIINHLDQMVDKTKIRNRSQAVEVLIKQALGLHRVKKAFILAGGKGTRMRPFTYEIPKCLIPVKGKAILQYLIEWLRKYEIREIIISVGHLADKIIEYFGNGKKFGVQIIYVRENQPLGTAGPLKLAKNNLDDLFLMLSGDLLVNFDLYDFISFHREHNGIVSNALTSVEDVHRFGSILLKGARIEKFIEKPKQGKELSNLINAAVWLVEPEILNYLPKNKKEISIEKEVLPKLAKAGKLFGYIFSGPWFAIDNHRAYEEAIKKWKGSEVGSRKSEIRRVKIG